MDVGVDVAVQLNFVGIGEDGRVVGGGDQVEEDALAFGELEGLVAVLDFGVSGDVTEETDAGAEAASFEEAEGWLS